MERRDAAETCLEARIPGAVVRRGEVVPRRLLDAFLVARPERAGGFVAAAPDEVVVFGPTEADRLPDEVERFLDAAEQRPDVALAGQNAEQWLKAQLP